MNARPAISWSADEANDATSDVAANATIPICSSRRRPNRSPRCPPRSSSPANTSVYASTTHCSWLVVADSSRLIVGRATLTIVLSTLTSNTDRHRTPRIHHRRSWVLAISSSSVVVRRSIFVEHCATARGTCQDAIHGQADPYGGGQPSAHPEPRRP